MKKYTKLFKRDTTGRVRVWWMEQDGNCYRTTSGLLDGEKITTEWTTAFAKNIGKVNETSDEKQAELEISYIYNRKMAQGGYKDDISKIDEKGFFKPMLARKYEDVSLTSEMFENRLVLSQPKLDGIRCIINAEGMWTRQGKPIISVPHIYKTLEPLFNKNPDLIFDGELYAAEYIDDFNKIVSLVRKQKPTEKDIEESSKGIQYWVYDLPSSNSVFVERFEELKQHHETVDHHTLQIVETHVVDNHDHLDELYAEYIERGMEGQIIRLNNKEYENKRSKQLLKRKDFLDDEFEIVEVQEGKGNYANMAGRIVCKLPDGRTFSAGIVGGVERYKQLLDDRTDLVGKMCTVKYFSMTPDGFPRFPKAWAIRDYE